MTIRSTHQFPITIESGADYTLDATTPRFAKGDIDGKLVKLGPVTVSSGNDQIARYRGIEIQVASDVANDSTGAIRVFLARNAAPSQDSPAIGGTYDLLLMGTLTFTSGATNAPADDEVLLSKYQIADEFVWTPATTATDPQGASDLIENAFAGGVSPVVYSPGNGLAATLVIPDTGNRDVVFDVSAGDGAIVVIGCSLWT